MPGMMPTVNLEELERISKLTFDDIGSSEENVKNYVVVPLLEALGHKGQLDFERRVPSGKADIVLKNLPRGQGVIVEVKNPDIELAGQIPQLETYCRETGALLGMITNGEDVWIFSPFWRGRTFNRQLILAIKRQELVKNHELLARLLSRDALTTKSTSEALANREREIEMEEENLEATENEYDRKIRLLQDEIDAKQVVLHGLSDEKNSKLAEARNHLGIPRLGQTRHPVDIERPPIKRPAPSSFHPLRMEIRGTRFDLNHSYDIIINTAEWLIKEGKLTKADCPVRVGPTRNLVNTEPKDQQGKRFASPSKLSNGLFVEKNYSTEGCITSAKSLLERFGYDQESLHITK